MSRTRMGEVCLKIQDNIFSLSLFSFLYYYLYQTIIKRYGFLLVTLISASFALTSTPVPASAFLENCVAGKGKRSSDVIFPKKLKVLL